MLSPVKVNWTVPSEKSILGYLRIPLSEDCYLIMLKENQLWLFRFVELQD